MKSHLTKLLALFLAASIWADDGLRGIHVTGSGEIEVAPDIANVSISVRVEGGDPATIKRSVDEVTGKILAVVRDLDIAKRDTTARGIQLQPNYRYDKGQSRLIGYVATRNIAVVLRDLDDIGPLMNRGLKAGANQISQPSYDHSEREKLSQQALERAIDNAKAQASHIAEQFGRAVGPVVDVRTSAPSMPRPMLRSARMEMADSAPMPIEAGLISISRTIQASFAFRE